MIKDLRATPSPPDFPVISEPGNFTGWTLTVDINGKVHSVVVDRTDDTKVLMNKLVALIAMLEAGDELA